MSSLTTSLRAAAAVAVLAVSANVGIASASASASNHLDAKVHHVSTDRPERHRVSKQSKKHHAKHHAKVKTHRSAKKAVASPKKQKAPSKPTKTTPTPTTTTTPTPTTTTTPTPTTTTTPTPTTTTTPTPTTTTAPTDPTTSNGTPQPAGIPGNWNLTLNSEFDGPSLPADWQTGWFGSGVTGGVDGTNEPDCYSPNNITFPGDGTMHINLTDTPSTCDGVTEPYTTGLVTTNPEDGRSGPGFQYTYGVLEARVYIPANGTQIADWPAVWTDGQSWPNDGEDDIMEGLSGQTCWHFHDPLGGPGDCDSSITPGWHTFASDWQPGSVTYYYDGVEVGSITTGITSSPMYIILGNGADAGDTIADSMQVQYVRVWQS